MPKGMYLAAMNRARAKHNMEGTKEYKAWDSMRQRCNNPRDKSYRHYGGRGIKVCKRWSEFLPFYKDMGPAPSKRHSIDRRNNNRNYCPSNCRWATPMEQLNNTRKTTYVKYRGRTQSVGDWARELGVERPMLRYRIKHWPLQQAMTLPKQNYQWR